MVVVLSKMGRSQPFYEVDLAFIHDTGYSEPAVRWARALLELLERAKIRDGLVVDLGCGPGHWAERLVEAGYEVHGLDVSPAMIERARRRVPSAMFAVGSLWTEPIPRCRALTALGEVVCFQNGESSQPDLQPWIARVSDALEPGGLLIFDVAEVGLDRERPATCVEGSDWACLVRFEYDHQRDQLARAITTFRKTGDLFRRSHERHVLQLYRAHEVADQLRKAGFRVRKARKFGSQPLLPHRIAFIARKGKRTS